MQDTVIAIVATSPKDMPRESAPNEGKPRTRMPWSALGLVAPRLPVPCPPSSSIRIILGRDLLIAAAVLYMPEGWRGGAQRCRRRPRDNAEAVVRPGQMRKLAQGSVSTGHPEEETSERAVREWTRWALAVDLALGHHQ
ncbi:hypothetical protein TARUN_10401 [Trichoderma arundinaceum]|uniref:Uncharacterized protein n=1 Tax=Trichoderma arundinaceum TaxID=490622 RepID=A0A395N7L1_TRIAR|nr:hypothetical protein TARUN_10401 [Trichoderma arundinaceum]